LKGKYEKAEEEINKLKEELDVIKTTINCKVINNDGVRDTYNEKAYNEKAYNEKAYNEKAYNEKQLVIAKKELSLGLNKYSEHEITKKDLVKTWENYNQLLSNKLEWLKGERPIRTKNYDYVQDMTAINELQDFINEEFNKYQSVINNRPVRCGNVINFIKNNTVALIIFTLLGIPILIGIIVSIPSIQYLSTQNDWIGFWGNYSGGIIGATIGGFVAYKIAKNGFEKQRQLDREEKITEMRMKSLPDFILAIISLQQKIQQEKQYLKILYPLVRTTYEKEVLKGKISFDSIKDKLIDGQKLIKENKIVIYDSLELYQKHYEINRFLVIKFEQKIQLAYDASLLVINQSVGFEDLFSVCAQDEISLENRIDLKSFDESYKKLQDLYDNVSYMLYEIIVALRNEISRDLFQIRFNKISKENYIK